MFLFMNIFNFIGEFCDIFRFVVDMELLIVVLYKMILFLLIVFGNGFLVLIGCVDFLRSFCILLFLFLFIMLIVNVFIGVIVELIFVVVEYNWFFGWNFLLKFVKVGFLLLLLIFNIFFGMVFVLIVDCFIVVFWLIKYRRWIIMKWVKIFVGMVLIIVFMFLIFFYVNV